MNKLYDFMVVDTEDDSKGRVYWINFFDGREHVSFRSYRDAVPWVLCQRGDIWAVNLEYDLINVFGPLLEPLSVLTYGGFGLLKSSLYGKPIRFFNTLRHWPMSVEEMGERLGFPKLPFDPQNLTYCRRDCEITWKFIREMISRYEQMGMDDIGATLPSTALKFYVQRFCTVPYHRHPDVELWKFLTGSRYGGRCEIFRVGPIDETVHEYDINSSYPAAMQRERFPDLTTVRIGAKSLRLEMEGAAEVRVTAPEMEYPILPYRDPSSGKLVFPVGTFSGTWAYPELRLAVERGYRIESVKANVEYRSIPSPFSDYIDYLYTRRMEVKESDPLLAYTLKIAMNSTYGKFGEEGDLTILSRGKRHQLRQVPRHSNMIWATYILAYGRINLYRYMCAAAERGELLYVDTDSVFVRCTDPPFPGGSGLGELAHKNTYASAEFKLPKLYRVDENYKAKGVPLDKQRKQDMQHLKREFFQDGVAEFVKPYRLMESKKLKELPNVWHTVSKAQQARYDKRIVLADGRTEPIRMDC